jgi:hypothetical protein
MNAILADVFAPYLKTKNFRASRRRLVSEQLTPDGSAILRNARQSRTSALPAHEAIVHLIDAG